MLSRLRELYIINIIIEVENPGNLILILKMHCRDSTAGHIFNDEKV